MDVWHALSWSKFMCQLRMAHYTYYCKCRAYRLDYVTYYSPWDCVQAYPSKLVEIVVVRSLFQTSSLNFSDLFLFSHLVTCASMLPNSGLGRCRHTHPCTLRESNLVCKLEELGFRSYILLLYILYSNLVVPTSRGSFYVLSFSALCPMDYLWKRTCFKWTRGLFDLGVAE